MRGEIARHLDTCSNKGADDGSEHDCPTLLSVVSQSWWISPLCRKVNLPPPPWAVACCQYLDPALPEPVLLFWRSTNQGVCGWDHVWSPSHLVQSFYQDTFLVRVVPRLNCPIE